MIRKEKENSSLVKLVNKEEKNNSPKKSNSLNKEINERLKSIERSMTYTQNNSLTELTKKIEILNSPLEKRDTVVLDITESSENEKTDRVTRNVICHKYKGYRHTKKQRDQHNKIVKWISELDFKKNIINELMRIFNVNQKEINQVKKKKELKSTKPLRICFDIAYC